MQITNELGQKIIERLSEYIDVDINIMNLDGKIVASTDNARMNEIHSGAIEVIKTSDELILNEKDVKRYPKAKPGVNLPILHREKVAGVVGVSGNPNEILKITGLIKVSVEIVIDQISIQRQVYYKERQWNYWLQQLLHPSGFNELELKEEAEYALNINAAYYWNVIVLRGENVQHSLEMIRREIESRGIRSLFILPFLENEIVITLGSSFNRLALLASELLNHTAGNCHVGVGEKAFGLKGIRTSYQEAKQALLFGKNKTAIAFSADWKLKRLTAAIPEDQYNRICLHYEQLLNKFGETYKSTIDTYLFTNFSVKKTADTLHIHRNTLLYRLDQIKGKVGLDPRSFHDAFLLKIIRCRNI